MQVVDLISLKPFDMETISKSIKKTRRAIIVEECMKTGGIGASLSAIVHESLFNDLDHEVGGWAGGRGGWPGTGKLVGGSADAVGCQDCCWAGNLGAGYLRTSSMGCGAGWAGGVACGESVEKRIKMDWCWDCCWAEKAWLAGWLVLFG
jgi:hypothetical protein